VKKQNASATRAESAILAAWRSRLDRLNEDVTGQFQLHECYEELRLSLLERRSTSVIAWANMVYMHGAAIGIRRAYRKGWKRQNVSIHGLLLSLAEQPSLIVRLANQPALRAWLGLSASAAVTKTELVAHLKAEIARFEREVADIEAYANTIAHLQKKSLTTEKRRILAVLKQFRALLDALYDVLDFPRPNHNEDRFVARFEQELERLLKGAEPA
jgi:hypothetical protein